ncbi:MAG TPA: HYR domain-containing protein [Saprospiraceae bacterium]|nr:HYR domain-containing protein [Saprospiraceae bacterium]
MLIADITGQTNIGCNGASTGSATVNATGGTTGYTYLWSVSAGSQTTATATNLPVGVHSVTVTDANNCTAIATVTIIQATDVTATAAQTTPVSCFGGSNGSATVTPGGGTLPYTYIWDNGSTDQTATGLSAGSHMVTVTDANGCTEMATVTITQPASAVAVTISASTNVSCFGGSNGAATAAGTGGTGTITYLWNNGQTTATATALTAGTYNVTATDANGCTSSTSVVITEPSELTANISAQTNVLCNGASTGSATVNVAGGTTTYTYAWSNGQTAATATGLAAGTYTVVVTDANGCTTSATVTITQPTALIAEISGQTNIGCNGASTGSATVNATGGTTGYTYLWSVSAAGQTTATATNLPVGVHSVTVTDANNCTTTATVTIIQATDLTATAAQTTPVSCFGGSNGSATVTPGGGTLPYTYVWDNGSTDQTATGLSAGSHMVTVTDANGCTETATVTITQPASAVAVTISASTNVSCFGGSNGAATAAGTGGTGTITYLWNNGQTTATATGLTAGTYNVTATDANGCTAFATIVITQPAELEAIVSAQTNVLCNGTATGSATILPAGGTAPYTYNWSNGPTTQTASGLTAGTYFVTITDAMLCKVTRTVTITQPTLLTIQIISTTDEACTGGHNGTATVSATGGTTPYNFTWPGALTGASQTGLSAGTYVVTVTDANNCTATVPVVINQGSSLTINPVANVGPLCPGTQVDLILLNANPADPATVFTWTGGASVGLPNGSSTGINPAIPAFISGATVGSATISLTATLGTCTTTSSFTITIDDSTLPAFTNCPVNMVFGNDPGQCGALINWQAPVATDNCGISGVSQTGPAPGTFQNAGTYTVTYTATDPGGNTASCSFTVTVEDSEPPNAICQDITVYLNNAGTVTVSANAVNGGSTDNCGVETVAISGGTFNCLNVGDNNLTLTVTDNAGNTASCVATVTVADNLLPTFTCPAPVTVSSCVNVIPDVVSGIIDETDNCGIASVMQNPAAGVAFGNTTVITVTVTDVHGNSATCNVPVTRNDLQAPVFVNCPTTTVIIGNDPDQCSGLLNWAIPVATDDCAVQSVIQTDGPLAGTAVSITCPVTTQTVTYTATDTNGNTATCSFQVAVADTEKPEFDADIVMPANITANCDAVPAPFVLTNNDVNDNCTASANLTILYNQTSTQQGNPNDCSFYDYILTRTWTVTDCAGNTLVHTQTITVQNNQTPVAVCQNITVTLDNTGTVTITPDQLNGGSSNACVPGSALTFTASQTVFDCSDVGENTVILLTVNDPCDNTSTCTAIVTVLEGPGSCAPEYDVEGSDPCVCLNNATTTDNGQFSELIQIHALAGQNWVIQSSTGLYSVNSPAPPASPIAVVNGSPLTSGLSDNLDNDGDNQIDEADEAVYYTFLGRHVDGIGYTAVLNNGAQPLSFSNKCYYPTPVFTNLADPFCLGTDPFQITVGENAGASGTVTAITVNGVNTNTFDANALGEGYHLVTATFDAGSAQPFTVVNGVTVNGSEAAAIADPGCQQTISRVVQVTSTPTTVVCNDTLHVSLSADCTFNILPDDVLEGTYPCFDDYLVQLDFTPPYGNGPWMPAQVDADDIGRYYPYRLTHPLSGNVCSGVVLIEDKLAPALTCPDDITIACSESTDVDHTGHVTATDCDTYTVVVDDEYTSFGQCTDPRAQIVRTFIVTDASGNQSTCSQLITIAPFDLADVVFPPDVTVNCEATYLNDAATAPVSTGAPSINGASIVGSALCGAQVSMTDEFFAGCGGTYTILRTWKVLNNCAPLDAGNPVTYVQRIQVLDLGGPVFACPGDVTVSVDGSNNCCATAPLPRMIITEGCSGILNLQAKVWGIDPATGNIITFTVQGSLADFPGNNYWTADTLAVFGTTQCLPRGVYDVLYTAEDQCGNLSSCSFKLTVEDLVPPVATCTQVTTVAIGTDDPFDCYTPGNSCESAGVTWVPASAFNQGSYDNCNGVEFTIRRMQETDETYSACIDSLAPLCDGFEYEVATAENDSIKFYCCEVGTVQTVILRVYQIDLEGNRMLDPDGEFIYNECMIQVTVQDKLLPVCQPPANVTVSCENFDPSLWAYGVPEITDNCCLDETPPTSADPQGQAGIPGGTMTIPNVCGATQKVYYNNFLNANFDTTCNRGTIIRRFTAWDCSGQSSSCTQRIVVDYRQDYNVLFPADVSVNCTTEPNIGKPVITNDEGCELIGISYNDVLFTVVPDACYKIERTWRVINWCTYNPDLPCFDLLRDPVNPQTGLAPAKSWHVWDGDNPAQFPDNCVTYKQIIKVLDQTPPTVTCVPVDTCDVSINEVRYWNDGDIWWDNGTQQHDLCEKETELSVTAEDLCDTISPEGGLRFRYLLFLDLDNDGIMETVVSSADAATRPVGQVLYNNYLSQNYQTGSNRVFDNNSNLNQRYRFDIEQTAGGAKVIWRNASGTKLPELPHGRHKIKWIAEDGCGNEAVCEKTFEIRDCKPPVVACANVNINLMIGGMATLWATDFFLYGDDNCTPAGILNPTLAVIRADENPDNTYPANQPQSVQVTCADEGTSIPVQVWLMDAAGNADFCVATIDVQANLIGCDGEAGATVAGALVTEEQEGVEDASLELAVVTSNGQQGMVNISSNDAGAFMFPGAVPLAGDYTLTPTKDNNPLNGVTTYDLVLINKHILGLAPLTSPYKIIAADANRSGSITTFDVVEIRKLILGLYSELPNNTSWRFVDKSFVFPEPSNPFQTMFPENISVQDVQSDHLADDFVGVKIGDVNNSVIANSLQSSQERTDATFLIDADDRQVKTGEVFTVDFKGAQSVQGFQFTMNLTDLEVVDLAGSGDIQAGNFGVFEGAVTASVDGTDNPFSITFRAKTAGQLSRMLGVSSRITRAEAYSLNNERLDVVFRFRSPAGMTTVGVGFEVYQNQPNPFVSKTLIGFHLPEAAETTLRVYDETGREVCTQKGNFPKGYNTFTIDRQLIATTGVLYYRVETPTDSATKKMIQSE